MKTSEVLKKARSSCEDRWAQGKTRYGMCPVGKVCAGIALDEVYGDTLPAKLPAHDLFRKVIGGESIVLWNDAPGRTKEEVLAAFDRAIALCKESGDE